MKIENRYLSFGPRASYGSRMIIRQPNFLKGSPITETLDRIIFSQLAFLAVVLALFEVCTLFCEQNRPDSNHCRSLLYGGLKVVAHPH